MITSIIIISISIYFILLFSTIYKLIKLYVINLISNYLNNNNEYKSNTILIVIM